MSKTNGGAKGEAESRTRIDSWILQSQTHTRKQMACGCLEMSNRVQSTKRIKQNRKQRMEEFDENATIGIEAEGARQRDVSQ